MIPLARSMPKCWRLSPNGLVRTWRRYNLLDIGQINKVLLGAVLEYSCQNNYFVSVFSPHQLVDMYIIRNLLLLVALLLPATAATQMSLDRLPDKPIVAPKQEKTRPIRTGPRYKNRKSASSLQEREYYLPRSRKRLTGPAYKNKKHFARPGARVPRLSRRHSSARYKNRTAKTHKL